MEVIIRVIGALRVGGVSCGVGEKDGNPHDAPVPVIHKPSL